MRSFLRRPVALTLLTLTALSSFTPTPVAHAQNGGGSGNVGNGGLGGEPQFRLLRDLLIQWIELGALNIDTRQSPKPVDWKEILNGFRTIPFQFDPTGEPQTIGSSLFRACTNDTPKFPGGILCNLKLWSETPEADKLGMVGHEFMGKMGYEPNNGILSEYWFSSQLLGKLRGESAKSLTEITPESFDASSVQPAPTEVLLFVKSLMNRKSEFTFTSRGTFHLKTNESFYRQSELAGVYLKNGDYLVYGEIGKGFGGTLGTETLAIRQARCPSIQLELVYTVGLGIRSISAETQCSWGNFTKGFEQSTTRIQKDGSVSIENTVVNSKKFSNPVEITVNGMKSVGRYVHPSFRASTPPTTMSTTGKQP
jgi:hypothetical protein